MIQFLGVTKKYKAEPKPITALDNVSFEVAAGEFVFLVGHSGSGKTTILRQIIREELPTEGKIFFDDNDITKLKRSGIYQLRREIGIIFQDYKLIEDKSSYENVAFAMEAAGHNSKQIKETVPYVLDIVNLSDRSDAFPKQLSGGEKQRVAIARAIANNPKLLIADEPTGNLDPDSAWDIVQILAKVNKWGTTVLMSTHGTEIVNSLQKRVLKMEKGKLVRDSKKGAYDDADEFSLKILGSQGDQELKEDEKKQDEPADKEEQGEKGQDNDNEDNQGNKDNVKEDKVEDSSKEAESEKKSETKNKKKDKKSKKDKEKNDKSKQEEKELKELLEKADKSDLNELKLPKEVITVLIKSGYNDVEDILTAGVDQVNKKLDQKQVRQLARAIKKFMTTE